MSPKAEYQPTHHRHRHRSPPSYIAFVLPPPLPLPPFRVPRPCCLTLLLFSSLLPFFHLLWNPPPLSNSHRLSSVHCQRLPSSFRPTSCLPPLPFPNTLRKQAQSCQRNWNHPAILDYRLTRVDIGDHLGWSWRLPVRTVTIELRLSEVPAPRPISTSVILTFSGGALDIEGYGVCRR